MLYAADLGSAGLTDVGYVWKDAAGADIGARVTAGVTELESGVYGDDITPATGAQAIYWDSAAEDTSATAMGGIVPDNFESLVIDSAGQVDADVRQWLGTTVATPSVAGVPEVDLTHVAGSTTSVSAIATSIASILADTGTDGVVVSTAQAQAIADEILNRSVSNVESTPVAHSIAELILANFEFALSGTTWTIKKTDGSTTYSTRTVTTDAAAVPITEVT